MYDQSKATQARSNKKVEKCCIPFFMDTENYELKKITTA